ncbi:MAG: DUF512 domain-containing protein, partial [Firmicutes bacterium]|nr:DUF512 domain-containing protein [Bacillota bacterium]
KDIEIGNISVATGMGTLEFIKEKAKILTDKFGGTINVFGVENEFFGRSVTVTGLVVGSDIINQLREKDIGERLLISSVMLKDGGDSGKDDLFLDNMTFEQFQKELKTSVIVVDNSAKDFVRKILKKN